MPTDTSACPEKSLIFLYPKSFAIKALSPESGFLCKLPKKRLFRGKEQYLP